MRRSSCTTRMSIRMLNIEFVWSTPETARRRKSVWSLRTTSRFIPSSPNPFRFAPSSSIFPLTQRAGVT